MQAFKAYAHEPCQGLSATTAMSANRPVLFAKRLSSVTVARYGRQRRREFCRCHAPAIQGGDQDPGGHMPERRRWEVYNVEPQATARGDEMPAARAAAYARV